MKKIVCFILAVTLLCSVSACTPRATSVVNETPTDNATPTPTEPLTPTTDPTDEPTPTQKPDVGPFLASEFIKNPELWNGKRLLDDKFQFIVEYKNDIVVQDGLGTNYNAFGGDFLHVKSTAGEWGYGLLNLEGIADGAGIINEYKYNPATREEAIEQIYEFLEKQYKSKLKEGDWLTSMNGHYPWHHYAGEAGFQCLGTEIGEGMASYQFRIAMNRGAAKQYGTTWFVDFSQWFGGYILDYTNGEGSFGEYSSPTGGHSINLMERSLLLSYMAGADAAIAEGGQYIVNYTRNPVVGGKLTPYGEFCKKFNTFVNKYSDLGTAYTPYAFILDKYHGMNISGSSTVLGKFESEIPDEFTYKILNTYIWKDALDGPRKSEESSVMTNTKFGDTFDFLLQNASSELINTYPVLIFTGDIKLSDEELANYSDYVKNGGKLIINTAHVPLFDKLGLNLAIESKQKYKEVKYGEGSFYIYGKGGLPDIVQDENGKMKMFYSDDWELGGLNAILSDLNKIYMPFEFSNEIGYSVSIKDGAMYLYVFNNNGVTKMVNEETVVDDSKFVDLTINYTGAHKITGVEDIYNGHDISLSGDTMTVHLEAGGMAVIEIKLD